MTEQQRYESAVAQRAGLERQAQEASEAAAAALARLADADELVGLQNRQAALVALVERARRLETDAHREYLRAQIADAQRRMAAITATLPEAQERQAAGLAKARRIEAQAKAEYNAVVNARTLVVNEAQELTAALAALG